MHRAKQMQRIGFVRGFQNIAAKLTGFPGPARVIETYGLQQNMLKLSGRFGHVWRSWFPFVNLVARTLPKS